MNELAERRTPVQGTQRARLVTLEPHDWRLAGGAVDALVGNIARPRIEVRLERRPALEPH